MFADLLGNLHYLRGLRAFIDIAFLLVSAGMVLASAACLLRGRQFNGAPLKRWRAILGVVFFLGCGFASMEQIDRDAHRSIAMQPSQTTHTQKPAAKQEEPKPHGFTKEELQKHLQDQLGVYNSVSPSSDQHRRLAYYIAVTKRHIAADDQPTLPQMNNESDALIKQGAPIPSDGTAASSGSIEDRMQPVTNDDQIIVIQQAKWQSMYQSDVGEARYDANTSNAFIDENGYVHTLMAIHYSSQPTVQVMKIMLDLDNARFRGVRLYGFDSRTMLITPRDGMIPDWDTISPDQGMYKQIQYLKAHYDEIPNVGSRR